MAAGGRTALWWDIESCPLPSSSDPYIVTVMASTLLRRFNIIDVNAGGGGCSPRDHYHFSAYEFLSETDTELDQTLINCGIRLQRPPRGNSREIEKMMMADVLLWAMDTPPPANIMFLVGNVDLSYLFEKLRQRSYNVFVVYNVFLVGPSDIQVPQGMLTAANECLGWFSFLQLCRSFLQPDPGFHGHFTITEKPKRPPLLPPFTEKPNRSPLLPSSTEKPKRPPLLPSTAEKENPRKISSPSMTNAKKKSGLFKEFKAWLGQVVNSEEYAETGYNISGVRKDFQKATGKILDVQLLGFLKVIDLLEECKDVAVLKEVKKCCHVAFPIVKPNRQNSLEPSPFWSNPNSIPKTESDPRLKLTASLDDFRKYIHQMVFMGQFSQGFLMSCLPRNFEERTGKFLDIKHLGYNKLSELVASYSHLVSVNSSSSGSVRLFPARFLSQAVPNNPNCNTTSKETSMNIHYGGTGVLKAEAELYSIFSGGSVLCAMGEPESELLSSMSVTSTDAKAESASQGHSIKSDSSNTPGGSQVSEWEEGHSSASSCGDSDQVEAYEFNPMCSAYEFNPI